MANATHTSIEVENEASGLALSRTPPFPLHPERVDQTSQPRSVSDLLAYHDRDFVNQVYLAILKRLPYEAELITQLDHLRSGRRSKVQLIEDLTYSAEGKKANTQIEGLRSQTRRRVNQIPVLGYIIGMVGALVRLPLLIRNQQNFEAYSTGQQQRIVDYIDEVKEEFRAVEHSTIADMSESLVILFDAVAEASGKIESLSGQLLSVESELSSVKVQLAAHLKQLEALNLAHEKLIHDQETMGQELRTATSAQQEFLIQEQAAIVATQKMALSDIQDRLAELAEEQRELIAKLSAQQEGLESLRERADTVRVEASKLKQP